MRVSKEEQATDNQTFELRSFTARAAHDVIAEFLDIESDSKSDCQGLNSLLEAASETPDGWDEMKAGLYMRVSKEELTADNQALELRAFAARAGHEVVAEFLDIESGSKADRQSLNGLLDAASRREFDLVLFVRLDRITRLGAARMHAFFEYLDAYGVAYKSLYDSWLDSGIPMLRDIMLSVIASFARNERETLIARTRAGLERAKVEGKALGRPRVLGSKGHVGDLQNIQGLHSEGWSQRRIASSLKLSKGTVQRALNGSTASRR